MPTETVKTEQFNRVLASLNYFSIFFAGFLFPLIVWIISKNEFEKHHAKRALISHIIAVIPGVIAAISVIILALTSTAAEPYTEKGAFLFGTGFVFIIVGYFIIAFIIMIWNVVQGIKVLRV